MTILWLFYIFGPTKNAVYSYISTLILVLHKKQHQKWTLHPKISYSTYLKQLSRSKMLNFRFSRWRLAPSWITGNRGPNSKTAINFWKQLYLRNICVKFHASNIWCSGISQIPRTIKLNLSYKKPLLCNFTQ